MATTITAAPTNVLATAYSNQKHECTLSDGTLVVAEADTTTNGKFYYSKNSGSTWTNFASSDVGGWANGAISSPWVDSGSIERIAVTWKQSGTSGTGPSGGARASNDIYMAVGTFNAGRTTLTWGAAVNATAAPTNNYNYPDIDAAVEGTGAVVGHVISQLTAAPQGRVLYARYTVDSSGVATARSGNFIDTSTAAGLHTYPSLVFDSSKNSNVSWSAGTTGTGKGARYRRGAYSSGIDPTWATEVEVTPTYYVSDADNEGMVCRWDGTRVVVAGYLFDGSTNRRIEVWDSTSFTAFTNRIDSLLNYSATTGLLGFGATIDTSTGDVYLFGSNFSGTYNNVNYYKATRAGTALTLGSRVVTDTFTGSVDSPHVYAWYSGSTPHWVYTKGSASPFSVTHDLLNTTPTIAYGASSLADASFPTTTTPTLTAYVTDPDSSQTLTVTFEVASDAGFSSIVYTGTNTAASPQTAGAVSKTTTALSKATPYYWRSRVSDGIATSANTATRTFTIYDDPVVAIGASTPATTVSTGGPTLNVGWTYTQAQSLAEAFYRVQVQTNGGATTYYDSGTLAGPTTSVALDAVALAIPTDTTSTALQVVVTTTAATTGTVITATKTFDIQWGVVTVGIVSPTNGAIVATTGITAQWTFASTRSKLQGSYRIRLMIASTGSVLLDTGFVTSAATSVAVAVVLVDGSTYSLEVTLKNDQGVLGT